MTTTQVLEMLENNNIVYQVKCITHIVVEGNKGYIDYWPTTGKWIERETKLAGFSARLLIQHILQNN